MANTQETIHVYDNKKRDVLYWKQTWISFCKESERPRLHDDDKALNASLCGKQVENKVLQLVSVTFRPYCGDLNTTTIAIFLLNLTNYNSLISVLLFVSSCCLSVFMEFVDNTKVQNINILIAKPVRCLQV